MQDFFLFCGVGLILNRTNVNCEPVVRSCLVDLNNFSSWKDNLLPVVLVFALDLLHIHIVIYLLNEFHSDHTIICRTVRAD